MTRSEVRVRISKDIQKQIAIVSIDNEIRTNICYEILLQYALDHIDKVNFK